MTTAVAIPKHVRRRLACGPIHDRIDDLERAMMGLPAPECPVKHEFTPGMYIRSCSMPAGSLVTSKVHKTRHPWVLMKGRLSIYLPDKGWTQIKAPASGITEPGSRRVAIIHEDVVWVTYHATDLTDPEQIEREITEYRDNLEGLKQASLPSTPIRLLATAGRDVVCR